jgi:hypothetical protein
VNYLHVTAAITFHGSYSLVEDIQGAGQMGCSKNGFGEPVYIAVKREYMTSFSKHDDTPSLDPNVVEWFNTKDECKRSPLMIHICNCVNLCDPTMPPCDNCLRNIPIFWTDKTFVYTENCNFGL